MTPRDCFVSKVAAGQVERRAGERLLALIDAHEADAKARLGDSAASLRKAHEAAGEEAIGAAARRADLTQRTIAAQTDILAAVRNVNDKLSALRKEGRAPVWLANDGKSGTYAALSAFLDADPHELANVTSAAKLARDIAGRAHATFAQAIGRMRSKAFGLKADQALELDFLRAAFGRADVSDAARLDAAAWALTERPLAERFNAAGGALTPRERYFPNPTIDAAKARALGEDGFKQLVNETVDRAQVIDFATGKPMSDARFAELLDAAWQSIDLGGEGPPKAFRGKTMLANAREAPRLFQMRDADAWLRYAEAIGTHQSPFAAAVEHISGMARDIALLEKLGPNPDATLRFMQDILEREPGRLSVRASEVKGGQKAAVKMNRKQVSRARTQAKLLGNLYAEVTGANRSPINTEMAQRFSDARSLLMSAQLGSAMLSSLNDPATLAMTSRAAGLDVANILGWATQMLTEPQSEMFAAQTGFMMDALAHTARSLDTSMGETIRTGWAARLGSATVRASGLRAWTEKLKAGFWLGSIAQVAHERGKSFAELDPVFREALGRAGVTADDWKIFAQADLYEPRPNAVFLRPADVEALGGAAAKRASEHLANYVNTFMESAVLEPGPRLRALALGDTKPGTLSGEMRRSLAMYRFFTGGLMYLHGARALARGWNGSRLGHGATTFLLMTALGALSMQVKEIAAGRDPISLDPSTAQGLKGWSKTILQGGGLGVFGDILQADQTIYGSSWASTFAGPLLGLASQPIGGVALANLYRAAEGKETHFLGDSLYVAARYLPGSSLWYLRLAFQRAVIDQAARWADPRAPQRFRRIEQASRKRWGQQYWWRPGQGEPGRAPDLSRSFGG